MTANFEMDIPVTYCDKDENKIRSAELKDAQVNNLFNFNLLSMTRMLGKRFKLKEDKKLISIYNKTCVFVFDTVIHTKHGALYCAIMNRKLLNNLLETANASVTEKTNEENPAQMPRVSGRNNDPRSSNTFGDDSLARCFTYMQGCAIAKVNQRNIPKGISDSKATKFNGWIYHNLAKIKVPEEFEGVTITKSNWHILVDEATKFKWSIFFETKGGIIKDFPKYMQEELMQGHLIKILRQDNAKENVAVIKMAQGKDWKIVFKAEFTAQKTPQQNLIAEMAFTVISAQLQSMMNAAQLPDELRFKLWAETVMTATYLNNLVIVTHNGEKIAR